MRLPALSERSITSVPALLADLAATRERCYAVDDEETTTGGRFRQAGMTIP